LIVEVSADVVRFGISIPLSDFASLASMHVHLNPSTAEIEADGRELVEADFPDVATEAFVRRVSKWGGYSGVGGRVLKLNSLGAISQALRQAHSALSAAIPDVAGALSAVNCVKALGTPSFASKHLRFLEPRLCPVFDAYLQEVLPYSFDPRGYAAFAADCLVLASELSSRGVHNPWPMRNNGWLSADVEAAVYMWVSNQRSG
jgi:hypothetical protein